MGQGGSKKCKPIPTPPCDTGLKSCPIPAPPPLQGEENPYGAKRGGGVKRGGEKLPSLCREAEESCQLLHYRTKVPGQLGVSSQLELATQPSRKVKSLDHPVWIKLTFHIPSHPTIYRPLCPRYWESFQRETLKKNKIDSSTIFTWRLFKFFNSLPLHCQILERYITKTFFSPYSYL